MKRELILVLFMVMLSVSFVSAAEVCDVGATLVNQDPYPAVPGEYVKVVFQVDGISNSACGEITVDLMQDFPYSLDPGVSSQIMVQGGVYPQDYASFLLAPYRVRIDEQAMDGENPIRLKYSATGVISSNVSYRTEEFNLTIEDLHTDFEIAVKDYDRSSNTLTFEILNVGEHDVEALTVEVPRQSTISVKGSNRNIVGSLDSNEDTTFSFEATPKDGEIELSILYNDEINVRRTLEKKVSFDASYYNGRVSDQNGGSPWTYPIAILIIVGVVWWWRRRKKKKKD